MQGRLLPPRDGNIQSFPAERWEEEFALAEEAELACIEWIYEYATADQNPLSSDQGVREMQRLATNHNVGVWSICADYFMEDPLLEGAHTRPAAVRKLEWLIERAGSLACRYIVLPFVDVSSLRNEYQLTALADFLRGILPGCKQHHVEVHLETDLPPERLCALLCDVGHACLRANLDTGNSASLGWLPQDELDRIGVWLGSVHVKDRRLGGGTVPLGTGDARLSDYFGLLRALDYRGTYILQAARGAPGEELAWARSNRELVERHLTANPLALG
jgi:L-ribulose-5-phosphate 3-epimerase